MEKTPAGIAPDTEEKYNRFAPCYDCFVGPLEWVFYRRWRKKYFSALKGKILDIGVGTGSNIRYYHAQAEVVGIDRSEGMLNLARQKLARSGKKNITLAKMDAEHLAFGANTFDYVITSSVFCSMDCPQEGLAQIRRVLKKGAKALMIEHVLSRRRPAAFLQSAVNPLACRFFADHLDRELGSAITSAGLELVTEKNLALGDVFRLFVARKT